MRVAIVHDWLTGMRGGERCLEVFCEIFPNADLYTLLHVPGSVSAGIERRRIVSSPLRRFPAVRARYRHYLPLFPWALRRLRPRGYDLILSSSHCVAKGISTHGAPHLCYCYTPMRYIWDRFADYFGPGRPRAQRVFGAVIRRPLQRWDVRSNTQVDRFIAISNHVAARIRKHYGRPSAVIYPPVDTSRFRPGRSAENYYLVVSALAPYKRVDLALEAFRHRPERLLVVGRGQDERRLRRIAPPNVTFLGWQSDRDVADLMRGCRALLFPGEEDFGITPLEAMASGRPVVALGRGGAVETVVDLASGDKPPTGVLFPEPSMESLLDAVERLERHRDEFDPSCLRAHAELFSRPRFRREIEAEIREFVAESTGKEEE